MREMGRGLEYKVYDQGKGRALKLRRSLPSRLLASFRYAVHQRTLVGWPAIVGILLPVVNGLPTMVARLATTSSETRKLFGNIEITQDCDYTQDIVTPFREYFAAHSLEENIAVIARYVELIKSLWSVGVGDPYYNFPFNAGVYADGSVAQIDVADLLVDGAVIGRAARRQIWLVTGITGIADEILRAECARLLNAGLTYETFLERWPRTKVSSSGESKDQKFMTAIPNTK
jgi:hypothetical protein